VEAGFVRGVVGPGEADGGGAGGGDEVARSGWGRGGDGSDGAVVGADADFVEGRVGVIGAAEGDVGEGTASVDVWFRFEGGGGGGSGGARGGVQPDVDGIGTAVEDLFDDDEVGGARDG